MSQGESDPLLRHTEISGQEETVRWVWQVLCSFLVHLKWFDPMCLMLRQSCRLSCTIEEDAAETKESHNKQVAWSFR